MAFGTYEGLESDEPPPAGDKAGHRKANGHAGGNPTEQPRVGTPIKPIRFADLKGKTPPPRRFIVEDWIPTGCGTSLYGPGGIGKTLLAQQIGTAVAVGRELFGFQVEKGPVLGLLCEDDDDELWRRQMRVNEWFACDMDQLDNLHLQGRAGLENTLAVYPGTGAPTVEIFHELIRGAAQELRPVLIILDPIAQLYGGNENDRFQVSHFINLVGGLAREFDCAVLLLGHPAKADGSEYSGSTAWNASVRSRLLLQLKKDEENELLLSRVKSNYAKPDTLSLHWVNGTLRPTAQKLQSLGDRIEAEAQAGKARTAFLAALDKLTAQGRNVSHSERATNYAPKIMAGLCEGFTGKELAKAMESLLDLGVITANAKLWKGADRKPMHGLARAPEPEPET
jgi:RecA-family ATPase